MCVCLCVCVKNTNALPWTIISYNLLYKIIMQIKYPMTVINAIC